MGGAVFQRDENLILVGVYDPGDKIMSGQAPQGQAMVEELKRDKKQPPTSIVFMLKSPEKMLKSFLGTLSEHLAEMDACWAADRRTSF